MGLATLTNASTGNVDLATLLANRDTRFWKGRLGRLNLICLLLIITMMTNGYDGSMMNNLQTLEVWREYFNNPQGQILGLFNAIQNIGSLAGLPFAPYVNDKFGRKKTIFFGACIMCCGVAIQTACQNFGMFIGARALIGFGLSFALMAAPTLLTELAFPTHRAPLTSLFNTSWYVGSIVAAWSTYGTFFIKNNWAWRIPSLLQGIPSVLQVCLVLFIPESPRWLVDNGKEEQARKILVKYHGDGNEDDPLVEYEMAEIKNALALDREIKESTTWKHLFTDRGNLRRMRVVVAIGFFSQWSGNGLVSYYLHLVLQGVGIESSSDQLIFNGVLQFYNLGTGVLGALLVDRVGRRKLWLTSVGGMLFSYTLWTIGAGRYAADANKNAGHLVVAMIFFFYGFYNIAMSALLVSYTVEILPYRIRSKGLMVMQLCVSAALVLNQYANPIALDAIGWKYYIVYTVWLAVEFAFLWRYIIETKGKNGILALEEIAQLFDGESKADQVRAAGETGVLGDNAYAGNVEDVEAKKGTTQEQEQVERV